LISLRSLKQLKNSNTEFLRRLETYFEPPEMNLVFQSYIEGFTSGELFLNDFQTPSIAVFWDLRSSIYVTGDSVNEMERKEAVQFVKDNILSRIVTKNHFHLKIGYTTETWEGMLRRILHEYNPKIRDRYLFQHSLEIIPRSENLENNVAIQEISKTVLEEKHYKNTAYLVEEIKSMWGSTDAFLKNGFGFCGVENKELLCWCTMEYLSNQSICSIGIETIRNAQIRGIATAVTHAFLQKCAQEHILTHWDCWKSNIPSVKLAQKTGFTLLSNYQVLSISR